MDNSLHSENTQNYAIAESKLSDDQVASLYEFIEDKLPGGGSSAESQILKLRYRPDEWDRLGAIQEAQDIAKKCISEEHELASYLEPREFLIVRTEGLQTYSCEYKADESSKETLYTAIVTANSPESYDLGETVYTVSGEGFKPKAGFILCHKEIPDNSWKIDTPVTGSRLDLIIVFQDVDRELSYDYPIDLSLTALDF